jgi:uncharacterized membrane protein
MASVFGGKPAAGAAGAPKKEKTQQELLDDAEAAEKKAIEEVAAQVPFSRLLAMNRPEWGYGMLGSVTSAAVGAVQVSMHAGTCGMHTSAGATAPNKAVVLASILLIAVFHSV